MNIFSNYGTFSIAQLTGNSANQFSIGLISLIVFAILFDITIFVIWVWSMFSMINLNIRFKLFLEEYQQQQGNAKIEDHNRVKELQSYKTDEQKKEERAAIIAKRLSLKPRKFYVWAAVSIPILLTALFIVMALFP